MTLLPRYDAANHAGSYSEETIYAIPIEGAACTGPSNNQRAGTLCTQEAIVSSGHGSSNSPAQGDGEYLEVTDRLGGSMYAIPIEGAACTGPSNNQRAGEYLEVTDEPLGEETLYAIPIEGAAVATTTTKAASTAAGMPAAGAAGNGQSAARNIGRLEAVPSASASTAGTAVYVTGAAGSRATVYDMWVSSYDKAKGTSSPVVGASSAVGHYQTAANTGSPATYRGVAPNDDQHHDVAPNDAQRTVALHEQAAVVGSGHGGKHTHKHGAARAAKKAAAGVGMNAGTGVSQKLAAKSEYAFPPATDPNDGATATLRRAREPAATVTATLRRGEGLGKSATVHDMGLSSHDKAKGASNSDGSRTSAGASNAVGHYQAAANTGSRGDQYRDVAPNDDQYRDVAPNDDQRTDALYEQAAVVRPGYGGKHTH